MSDYTDWHRIEAWKQFCSEQGVSSGYAKIVLAMVDKFNDQQAEARRTAAENWISDHPGTAYPDAYGRVLQDMPRPPPPWIPDLTRQAVLKRAGNTCEGCGNDRVRLEMHHLHYETVGIETPDDLETLCRSCHLDRHLDENGEFWCDPVEMEHHWQLYYDALDKDD